MKVISLIGDQNIKLKKVLMSHWKYIYIHTHVYVYIYVLSKQQYNWYENMTRVIKVIKIISVYWVLTICCLSHVHKLI